MRIGILTFHRAKNYGAAMQAVALHRFLTDQGFDVDLLDYQQPKLEAEYKMFSINHYAGMSFKTSLKYFIDRTLSIISRYLNINNFKSFILDKASLSNSSFNNALGVPPDYDAYVFGSDQIWNPRILGCVDPVFLGLFEHNNAKLISYAASMGNEIKFDSSIKDQLKLSLEKFHAIGVREMSLSENLKSINIENEVVLDPTLIVSNDFFSSIAVKPKSIDKYVLVYFLEKNTKGFKVAEKYAKSINARLIQVTAKGYFWDHFNRKKIVSATPEEFLGWFKHASFIFTISFHGTVFSILFKKNFYTFCSSLQGRSENLLNNLGLKSRLVDAGNYTSFEDIDYVQVDNKLKNYRKISIEFLLKSLK